MDGEKWGEERKVDKRAEKVSVNKGKKGENRNGKGKEKRRKERRR